ncbi:putative rhamnogalacturonase B [Lachnellula arida]|uniref:Putative rhamnogalacturonase B n=1 Tax=Lachnellula arida TaxID=1316785 RepID=A0A8T9BD07_9HELO|nr:putative rhamnogalacturonase B [Lachnellula arida]
MKLSSISTLAGIFFSSLITAQLSGTVGPTTSTASKAAVKVCNILDYGGVASTSTDNGAAILAAWTACVDGGEVYIPAGDYGLATWVTLTGGTGVAIRLDGILYRTGTASGNMIFIEHTTDFEFFSSTSAGAIQGYGYVFHADGTYGPRLLRLYEVVDFSIHDIALVDSPAFHLTLDTCSDGEVYNMIIRGGNEGGLDGIDNPASYMLIEQIYCNWSGGSAFGSLGADTDIHDITYNHIYTQNSNQMLLLKSNGGSGSVYSCSFTNFMGHSNAYTLDIDGYWSSETTATGDGVLYHDLTFSHWHGTCLNGGTRAAIQALCPSGAPCYNIDIENFYIWTEAGSEVLYKDENAYGSGGGLNTGTSYTTYAVVTKTVTSVPAASYAITTMAADLTAGFDISSSIPIPTVPSSFYPGLAPISALLG